MSFQANKPEFALKRAQELMDMGNKEQALETLSVIAVGPKKQKIWSKKLELLVTKFCLLCVDLNKASKARDGLRAFKQISQQNPQSVELVVNEFLQAAEKAIDQVKSDSFVDPLSKINLDPSLAHLVRGITVDEFTGHADKENVRPKVKFLFEAYIVALETLKNNPKLEGAFKNVAKQAFEYCVKYHRVSEFKRITNPKNLTQSYVDSEETLTSQLEVKFAQLNASVTLELWSEAHNAINDIYSTLHTTKAVLSKDTYINYYAQLEKLLWVSKSFAPHAEALLKYSELKAERDRNLVATVIPADMEAEARAEKEKARDDIIAKSQNENKVLYSRIMLAALCIPLNAKNDDPYCIFYDAQKEKETRLAALLNFEPRANRSALLKYLSEGEGSILDKCEASVVTLFKLLEVNVQPFVFAKEVNKHLATLSETPEYRQYCVTLQTISFVKLLQKLSTVYQSMEIVQLQKLFPSLSVQEVQKQAIFARGNGQVDCMIDHRREVINFAPVSLSSQDVRYKLAEIACNLRKCVALVDTPNEAELAKKRERVFKSIAAQIPGERQRLIERRQYIEKMKELREAEEAKNQKLAHERHVKAVAEAEKREAEKVRKAQEAATAVKTQKQKEIEEKKREMKFYNKN
jgi:translation initiation factor 3 subunit A